MFEAFSVGPAIIWTRVVFLLLGIWLATEFFLRLAESAHLSLQHFRENSLRYAVALFACGRFFALIAQYRVYLRDPIRIFIVWDGNFSFVGAAVGIAAVLYWATKEHRTTFLQWLDVLLPATIFGLAFDWFGMFASGQAYGKPTDVFFGVTYDAMSVRYTVPIHPVQLYYAFFYLFLTFLLLVIRKQSTRAGSETACGIILASIATFFFEYFRGDFTIPVFATRMDFAVLILLFVSLGIFAAVENRFSQRAMIIYEVLLLLTFFVYLIARAWLQYPTFELRFSQFLAVLASLGTVVYVIVHRRRYPHL
ncbi:prolipoprotein diacylglyceryl transferase [Candidatus Peregrinibacteria bacterium]|nr:prolipoprotein diacylglyceryl transferase [Candidatus Peregrinibacteria bacterium]